MFNQPIDEKAESFSLDVTEYEQLMDFHKRMDQMQKDRTNGDLLTEADQARGGGDQREVTGVSRRETIACQSPTNLSYQRKEEGQNNRQNTRSTTYS